MADGFVELTQEKLQTKDGINELNRMLQLLFDNVAGDANTVRVYRGYGSPLNVVAAGVGSIYMRLDGSAGAVIYEKESASDASGWVAL